MMKVGVAAAVLSLIAVMAESAENGDRERFDRFQLWNECRPMRLIVWPTGQKATAMGLTVHSLEVAVRSRLRGARVYTEDSSEALWTRLSIIVNVNADVPGFSTSVEYQKFVRDFHDQTGYAIVWVRGKFGTHGENASFIRNGVAETIDAFLDEYLRVNDAACKERHGQ